MRICTHCGRSTAEVGFSRSSRARDGLQSRCRPCQSEARAIWRELNPERARLEYAEWRAKNPGYWLHYYRKNVERESARKAADRVARLDEYRTRERIAQAADPEGMRTRVAKRRAQRRRANPPWADSSAIASIYRLAAIYSVALGEPLHVDHIIPLQGALVSGLHCEANLQILPKRENQSKGNRFPCS